jgi:hypothetical protein
MVFVVPIKISPTHRVAAPVSEMYRRPNTSCRYPLKGAREAKARAYEVGNQELTLDPPTDFTMKERLPDTK